VPAAPAPSPANINILVEGQSNAAAFFEYGGRAILRERVRKLLGLHDDQTITMLGEPNTTVWSGVGLIESLHEPPAWLSAMQNGGWRDNDMQTDVLSLIRKLPAGVRASPTAMLWLHNETDSLNPHLTRMAWESAIRHVIDEQREALGQSATTTPLDFVYVPSDCPTRCMEISGKGAESVQTLKAGFEDLSRDATFNAQIGAQIGDADMDGLGGTSLGGLHFDSDDVKTLALRLSTAMANQLWKYAQPGSPAATAKGALPFKGPEVVEAFRKDPHILAISLRFESERDGLLPLSGWAAQGAGWRIRDGKTVIYCDTAHVELGKLQLSFPVPIPSGKTARLYYGWGSGRIAAERPLGVSRTRAPGRHAAVYDTNGLPVFVPASGVAIDDTHPRLP
jgi:hypothetical protein